MKILYKSKNAVVVFKPCGVPSQSDPSGDPDAMTLTARALADNGEPSELWLIHRLDRCVSGLLIFARNKRSAALLSESVRERAITKEYLAVVTGDAPSGELCDLLYKDSRTGKAYVTDRARTGVKEARLTATPVAKREGLTLVAVELHTGRFHQIRAQLSARHASIVGDKKYGSRVGMKGGIALSAYHLAVEFGSERVDVRCLPDTEEYPWCLFEEIKRFGE